LEALDRRWHGRGLHGALGEALAVFGAGWRHRRGAGPRAAHQRLRDLAQEAAWECGLRAPVEMAAEGAAQVETVARARDADVAEPALLGHLAAVRLLQGPGVGQEPLFDADQEDDRELQALDHVEGDQGDAL